jgi:hypothetical protein
LSELENGKRTVELGRTLAVLAALDLTIDLGPAPAAGAIDLDDILDEPS